MTTNIHSFSSFWHCQYSNTKNHFWHLSLLLNMQMLVDIYQTNLTDCICCMQQHIFFKVHILMHIFIEMCVCMICLYAFRKWIVNFITSEFKRAEEMYEYLKIVSIIITITLDMYGYFLFFLIFVFSLFSFLRIVNFSVKMSSES